MQSFQIDYYYNFERVKGRSSQFSLLCSLVFFFYFIKILYLNVCRRQRSISLWKLNFSGISSIFASKRMELRKDVRKNEKDTWNIIVLPLHNFLECCCLALFFEKLIKKTFPKPWKSFVFQLNRFCLFFFIFSSWKY